MDNENNNVLKELAKRFADKYYPEYSDNIDLIWNRILGGASDNDDKRYSDGNMLVESGLGFSGKSPRNENLRPVMFGVALFALTGQDNKQAIKTLDIPPVLKKRLYGVIAEHFGSSDGGYSESVDAMTLYKMIDKGIAKRIEDKIEFLKDKIIDVGNKKPLILPEETKSYEKCKKYGVELDFSERKDRQPCFIIKLENEIVKEGKITNSHNFLMLKEFLERGRLSWTFGFIISREWREGRIGKDPRELFRSAISKISTETLGLGKDCPLILPKGKAGRYLDKINREIIAKDTICTARETANSIAPQDEPSKIAETLEQAFYNYPGLYEANKKLIGFLERKDIELPLSGKFAKLNSRLLAAEIWLGNRRNAIDETISLIRSEAGKTDAKRYWKEAEEYLDDLDYERDELEFYLIKCRALLNKTKLSDDEAVCRRICQKIRHCMADSDAYDMLINEPTIADSFKICVGKLNEHLKHIRHGGVSNRDAVAYCKRAFKDFIGTMNFNFQSTQQLKEYIIKAVSNRVIDIYSDEELDISPSMRKHFVELARAEEDLFKKLKRTPSEKELTTYLNWEKDRFYEVLSKREEHFQMPLDR